MLSTNYGFISVNGRSPREGGNNTTGKQLDNIEGQVVSSHTHTHTI